MMDDQNFDVIREIITMIGDLAKSQLAINKELTRLEDSIKEIKDSLGEL